MRVSISGTALKTSNVSLLLRVRRKGLGWTAATAHVTLPSAMRVVRDRAVAAPGALRVGDTITVVGTRCEKPSSGALVAARVYALAGIHRIRHLIFIMQENRSFDEYFGTYPGADGIPTQNGAFSVCVPDPLSGTCVAPYHDSSNGVDLAHSARDALTDIDGGKMDGFIRAAEAYRSARCRATPLEPGCSDPDAGTQAMGYKDRTDIPNYWAYADHFVLEDHLFEPNLGWSLPAHLFMVSAWSARCSNPYEAATCKTDLYPDPHPAGQESNLVNGDWSSTTPDYGWTDITYLLHSRGVSWAYYVDPGTQPDCDDGLPGCKPEVQNPGTPEIWNPLPDFVTVHQDGQVSNVQSSGAFFTNAAAGRLPNVAWIVPNQRNSEHAPNSSSVGERWVTRLINAVMEGPQWSSSAIFVAWDDWGGFYDHMPPPTVDGSGYGMRVPGLLISPYARRGYVGHQNLSFDAYLKLVEDDFLGGQRLDPATDGRPDPRPDVRENAPQVGNLAGEFDFTQTPRRPLILPST